MKFAIKASHIPLFVKVKLGSFLRAFENTVKSLALSYIF